MSLIPIKLIRYLIQFRINAQLVFLHHFFTQELSLVLGDAIADQLSGSQSGLWKKQAVTPWEQTGGISRIRGKKIKPAPDIHWPVETVIFHYPRLKQFYGPGEPVFIELKLMGPKADHGFFLEVMIPVLEQLGRNFHPKWNRRYDFWGRYDIEAVYTAHGNHWEPLVKNGRLDLTQRPSPFQWAQDLLTAVPLRWIPDSLLWLTPVDTTPVKTAVPPASIPPYWKTPSPTLTDIFEALIFRLSYLISGKWIDIDTFWDFLDSKEKKTLKHAFDVAANIDTYKSGLKKTATSKKLARTIGKYQIFSAGIEKSLLPYLTLASIVHIGKHTHLGNGTFLIKNSMDI
jgi:hypothetical protein